MRRLLGVHLGVKFHDLRRRCAKSLMEDAKASVASKMNWKCAEMVDLYTK